MRDASWAPMDRRERRHRDSQRAVLDLRHVIQNRHRDYYNSLTRRLSAATSDFDSAQDGREDQESIHSAEFANIFRWRLRSRAAAHTIHQLPSFETETRRSRLATGLREATT